MSNEEHINAINLSLETAKSRVEMANAINRLRDNADFKLVFNDNYFRDEPARLVLLKADDSMQSDEHQQQISNKIDAIGHTFAFINTVLALGNMAAKAIEDSEDTLEELRREDLEYTGMDDQDTEE